MSALARPGSRRGQTGMARSGVRRYVRESVGCPACGAKAGEHCVAYRHVRGKTTGRPTGDVHAARWRAWRERRPGVIRG